MKIHVLKTDKRIWCILRRESEEKFTLILKVVFERFQAVNIRLFSQKQQNADEWIETKISSCAISVTMRPSPRDCWAVTFESQLRH